LEPGSVVPPGNWGRILGLYPLNQPQGHWLLVREEVFESVRRAQFPQRPSRLESLFVCESLEEILAFRQSARRGLDLAYEVELVDEGAASHRACLSVFDGEQEGTISFLRDRAVCYWKGVEIQRPEVVTTSPIRIVRHHPG
jgi:hypothetical protein